MNRRQIVKKQNGNKYWSVRFGSSSSLRQIQMNDSLIDESDT